MSETAAVPVPTRPPRRFRRGLRLAGLAIPSLGLSVVAGLLLGAVPYGARPAGAGGVTLYVASNGFHTDIVVPTATATRDWRPLLAASPITQPWRDAPWLALGWGSESAYTELGTLADLSPGLMLRAVAFDRSVVHVQPLAAIRESDNLRRFTVSAEGYRRLVRHIEQSLLTDAQDGPVVLPGASHGTGDAFLRGRERFWLLRSCNVWVGEALRKAGLPVGLWTPLAQSLMWSLGPGEAPGR